MLKSYVNTVLLTNRKCDYAVDTTAGHSKYIQSKGAFNSHVENGVFIRRNLYVSQYCIM